MRLLNATSLMIRIDTVHNFPVSVSVGFAYITDMNNWARYWPDFVRIQDPATARWRSSGDRVTVALIFLNRERELHMQLEEFLPETRVTYHSCQAGLPDAHHERHFRSVPGGFEYRLVVTYEPRPGLVGFFDRSFVRWAIARALQETIRNLTAVFYHS